MGILSSPLLPTLGRPLTLTAAGRRDQDAVIYDYPRFLLAHVAMQVVGLRAAHALLPDRQMDGVFEAVVERFDMSPGCPDGRRGSGSVGFGFWVNAVTTLDAQRAEDPRPALRDVSTPMLVLRGKCDYIAWEATREYRDLLPGAVLLAIDDAGHVIQADQPELHHEAIRAFLVDAPLPQEPYTGTAAPR